MTHDESRRTASAIPSYSYYIPHRLISPNNQFSLCMTSLARLKITLLDVVCTIIYRSMELPYSQQSFLQLQRNAKKTFQENIRSCVLCSAQTKTRGNWKPKILPH